MLIVISKRSKAVQHADMKRLVNRVTAADKLTDDAFVSQNQAHCFCFRRYGLECCFGSACWTEVEGKDRPMIRGYSNESN